MEWKPEVYGVKKEAYSAGTKYDIASFATALLKGGGVKW